MNRGPTGALLLLLLATACPFAQLVAAGEGPLADAIEHFDARRYEAAKKLLAPYAASHPGDAQAAFYLGRAHFAQRAFEPAVEWLQKAAALAPGRGDVQLWLARALGRAAQQASVLRQPGLAGRARDAWLRAVELDPGDLEARSDLIQFYLRAPGFMGGGVDKARAQAEQIARRDAARGALARATIALDQKDVAGATRLLQEAIAAHPAEPRLRLTLGALHQSQQRWDAALAVYDALLAIDPQAWEALYQIGRLAALSGRHLDRGASSLRRYLAHTPGPEAPPLANAHHRLGMVLAHQGDRSGARAAYQAALRLDPQLDDAKQALAKLR